MSSSPASNSYELEIDERDAWVVARITGEVDHSNVAAIGRQLRAAANGKPLVVDLSDTRYLDSAGVAMLDALRPQVALVLVVGRDSIVRRVLEITAFDQVVPMFSSIEAAGRGSP